MSRICFHCHEDIPVGIKINAQIDGEMQPMCCYGCKAVAEFINEQGYCEFYDYRGASQPASKSQVADKKWLQYDDDVIFNEYASLFNNIQYTVSIRIDGIYCSACGWLIDKHLRQLKGIKDVKLNTISKLLQVKFDKDVIKLSEILTAINYLGYQPQLNADAYNQDVSINERKKALKRLVVAGFGMMFIMTLSVPLYGAEYQGMDPTIKRFFLLISLFVATAVFFYSGRTFLLNAIRDLSNKHLGMDVPIALSITLAYGVSSWNVLTNNGHLTYFDSMVMFIFFLLAGRFVEMTVRHQGMDVEDALSSMIPSTVKKVIKKSIQSVPFDSLSKGDLIKIEAGDVVAIDGVILKGKAKVNESMITGESQAVSKTIKDTVMAGSRLDSGAIIIKSTAIGDDTILASLSHLLENAQLQKPKTLLLVDKVAGWFVSIVLILAAITAVYYLNYHPDKALPTVLAVLVATCPCALSLATPAALTAASVRLMKSGVLINNLDAIAKINKIDHWFIDKTGTLTEPFMSVHNLHNYSDFSDPKILEIMATLEHNSSHPIASAFSDYYTKNQAVTKSIEKSSDGVQAVIDGHIWKAGRLTWCDQSSKLNLKSQMTLIYLSRDDKLVAAFELQNKLRKGAMQFVEYLQKRKDYIALLSGDKDLVVTKVARTLRIDNYLGEQTPEQKINVIKYQQDQGLTTIMIGDGINDAPVLAQSDVSISFNQGTQLARAASDFIIMGNSLISIVDLLEISHKTNRIIKQNIVWALLYNLSVTPLAMMGYLTPWMAAIGMSISSLFVVLNAKRILLK
jgi:Cu2+-exporting ATPase